MTFDWDGELVFVFPRGPDLKGGNCKPQEQELEGQLDSMEVEIGPSASVATRGQGGHHQLDAYGRYVAGAFLPMVDGNAHDDTAPLGSERTMRKRKAESQDNERLSKRLSLLNIGRRPPETCPPPRIRPRPRLTSAPTEQNGQKLYVPVESPHLQPTTSKTLTQIPEGDAMELENTKHKVYIYDLDAELEDGVEADDGRLVFLPDIEKHLAKNRIPSGLLANSNNGGGADMQLVLYQEPSSLSVPQEFDSVRKAIAETRARLRQKQQDTSIESRIPNGLNNLANDVPVQPAPMSGGSGPWGPAALPEADPDAMDVD